ncbi:MAG: hypothetical protein L6367_03960 [Cellulomonas sp.]|nr:hypothetical protein [Cellulomonas sp.]
MRDLHEVLAGSLSARERAVAGRVSTEDVLAGTVSRVRRRRRVRAAARGGAVLGVGALVVGASWGVWGRQVPVPAVSPTVSASPTPTPTPTVTPTPTPTPTATETVPAAPTTVSVLGLGDLPQATEATLAQATTGWALIAYSQQEAGDGTQRQGPDLVNALLLADPDGTLYHLTDLPSANDVPVQLIGRWVAGQRTATVAIGDLVGDTGLTFAPATLDLLTGVVTQSAVVDGYPLTLLADGSWLTMTSNDGVGISYARVSSDGVSAPLAEVSDILGESMLSPDGAHVVVSDSTRYAVVDTVTGDVVERSWNPTSGTCTLINWVDDDTVAASCAISNGGPDTTRTVVTNPTRIAVRVGDGVVTSSVDLQAGDFWASSGVPTTAGLVMSGGALETTAEMGGMVLMPENGNSVVLMSADGSTEALDLSLPGGVGISARWSVGGYAYLGGRTGGLSSPKREVVVVVDGSTRAVTTPFDVQISGATDSLAVLVGQ